MISQVIIKNFESHVMADLQFVEGVNVIIGPSDAGKSAVLRAINWLRINRPLGDNFRSEWGGDTSVEIQINEHNIKRLKTKKENAYIINGDKQNAGSSTPENIEQILCIPDENVCSQVEPPFLFSCSAGEVAQYLNKAARIDEIDKSTSYFIKALNSLKSDKKSYDKQLKEQETELAAFPDLNELEGYVTGLEAKEQQISNSKKQVRKLKGILNRIQEISEEIKQYSHVDEVLKRLDSLYETERILETKQAKYAELQQLLQFTNSNRKKHRNKQKEIEELEQEYQEILPEQCPICGNDL